MKILVVDDEETNCQVLKKLLTKDLHAVFIAKNGKECIEIFDEINPDLVLMDVMMPIMDGYEAAGIIKEKTKSSFVPVIFITALENDEALIRCLESGGDDFISKPFKVSVLRAKIAAMERIRQLQYKVSEQNRKLLEIQNRNAREMVIAEEIFNKVVDAGQADSNIFRTYHKPAENFNGDIVMAIKSPKGSLNIMIGDFTGHGLASAMCTMPVVDIFKKMTAKGYGVERIIKEVSKKIKEYLPSDRFFASCFISIDPKEKSFSIWNGGMPDVYVFNKDQGIFLTIPSDKLPLGILSPEDTDTALSVYDITQGDKIFAYSDGLIELQIDEKQMFGDQRLKDLINKNRGADNIVALIENEISPLIKKLEVKDDVTFLEASCDLNKLREIKATSVEANHYGDWNFTFELDIETIKHLDPVPVMLSFLEEMQEFRTCRDRLFTILSEMYNNALEHGLLNLDSSLKNSPEGFGAYYDKLRESLEALDTGSILVSFNHKKSKVGGNLIISMKDSGNGFNVGGLNNSNSEDAIRHGRGLMLVKHLCKDFWFNDIGNQSNALLEWSNA